MKVLLEIVAVVLLINLGWRQPFHEQFDRITNKPMARATPRNAATPAARAAAAPLPRPEPSWMRRPGTLDRTH